MSIEINNVLIGPERSTSYDVESSETVKDSRKSLFETRSEFLIREPEKLLKSEEEVQRSLRMSLFFHKFLFSCIYGAFKVQLREGQNERNKLKANFGSVCFICFVFYFGLLLKPIIMPLLIR